MKLALAIVLALTTACKKDDKPPAPAPAPAPAPVKPPEPTPDPVVKAPDPVPPTPTPAPTPAVEGFKTIDEAGTAMLAMLDKVAKAVAAAKGDCLKLGAGLKALTPEVRLLEARGKSIDNDPALEKAFDAKYAKRVEDQVKTWMDAAQKCEDNVDVQQFFAAME